MKIALEILFIIYVSVAIPMFFKYLCDREGVLKSVYISVCWPVVFLFLLIEDILSNYDEKS